MIPELFQARMKNMLGGEYDAFFAGFERENCQALRVNPLKQGDGVKGKFKLTPVSWEEFGFYYDREDQPGKHPLHEAGAYYIQEPSAMAVAPLLFEKPRQQEELPALKILDLCAAPGGKSTQIAGYMRGKGLLVSNEIHPARAKILSENIERMGVRNALVTNETPAKLSEKFAGYFDGILVDAPCSGEGMFRKAQIACEEWSPENVQACADRQDEILDCAAKMLRAGGRMVYSTCTFAPAENEGSVYRFLQRHGEFEILAIDKPGMGLPEGKCDGRPEWAEPETDTNVTSGARPEISAQELKKTLRLWPHIVQGEGHFAAVLRKKAADESEISARQDDAGNSNRMETIAAGGPEPGISAKDKDLRLFWDFCEQTLTPKTVQSLSEGKLLRFGENLYLAPDNLPSLKGLKVLRPGLHLGEFKKNRFEPSHALALALAPDDVRHACHISSEDPLAAAYLSGQTFAKEGEKGWYLIVTDGYSLGWGKLVNNSMKNFYPKGLRK